MNEEPELLEPPCVFCGYNGPGYWQPDTHKPWCPVVNLSEFGRKVALRKIVHRMAQLWMAATVMFDFRRDTIDLDIDEASDT